MPNVFVPLGPNASLQEVVAVLNANFGQLDNEAVSKTFRGPGGYNAYTNGRLPNSVGYGFQFNDADNVPNAIAYFDPETGQTRIKIAEAGVDVTTASDDQLVFNSSQNVFKIIDKIELAVAVSNSAGTYGYYSATYAHGLDHVPAYIGYVENILGTGQIMVPAVEYVATGVAPSQILETSLVRNVIVDSTNVVAYVETVANIAQTFNFVIYLLQETAD